MAGYKKTRIDGVYEIKPKFFSDSRGFFYESFNEKEFERETGISFHPVQENISKSCAGVIRGFHLQNEPYAQAKLVTVIKGSVIDVAVDLRKGSKTFGKSVWINLTEDNRKQFFIPKGFAHGFLVLSDEALFQYKVDEYWHPESEEGVAWNDKDINFEWKHWLSAINIKNPILSEKDKVRKTLEMYKLEHNI